MTKVTRLRLIMINHEETPLIIKLMELNLKKLIGLIKQKFIEAKYDET